MSKLRNISQSAQEREIVKTAPDMVVYIEGMPFIENPFLKQSDRDITVVNFNDFVTSINTSYSIDSFIPTGTVMLSVPNGSKHLFMAPGGTTIFEVMSSIRIYAKGYFFSKQGNTVYRRVFNGLIKGLDFNETQTSLEITLSIAGICRLLEITQIELNKSLVSESSAKVSALRTNQYKMSIYSAIYDTFDRALDFSEFLRSSLIQDSIKAGAVGAAIRQEYINKWALRLHDLRRDIRIFGSKEKAKDVVEPITDPPPADTQDAAKGKSPRPPKQPETKQYQENKGVIDLLKKYHFDMAIGGINLMGNQLVPKIERVRQLVDMAGFEGYQDIDGLVIIKPPLYNLDSTMMGDPSTGQADLEDENLYEEANPFIINMAEILTENYSEDENGVRRTSMTLAPNFANPNGLQIENQLQLSQIVRYVDINLLRQFGVREEPPKYFGFLTKDMSANYGFAVCELNKANRNFRTYHLSIPLRPELRLGFPIYVPHKDMYAYIVGAGIAYNVGGQATMSLTCNYIRKRPLRPQWQTVKTNGVDTTVIVYASQPNLVHAWTQPQPTSLAERSSPVMSMVGTNSTNTRLESEKPSTETMAVTNYARKKAGVLFETWVENFSGAAWRIQKDDGTLPPRNAKEKLDPAPNPKYWYNGELNETTNKKENFISAGMDYLHGSMAVQPYTDEKGYEVIPLLPWGRYTTLREALVDTTRNYWYKGSTDKKRTSQAEMKKTSAFLTAGLALPNLDPAADLTRTTQASTRAAAAADMLNDTASVFERFEKSNLISFEMDYSNGDWGRVEQDLPSSATEEFNSRGDMQGVYTPSNGDAEAADTHFMDKVTTFLQGFIGPENSGGTGPYAVSLLPQNTDIGGYRPPAGPLSGVLLSMASTFQSSPYGDIFGLRPTATAGSSYFSSGYEASNRGTTTSARYSSVNNFKAFTSQKLLVKP
jgi:hypothetical protein